MMLDINIKSNRIYFFHL